MEKINIGCWKLAHMQHDDVLKTGFDPTTVADITASGVEVLEATVPGNFELDFIRAGKLPEDIYCGENVLELQKLEGTHLWYFTEFSFEENGKDAFLLFEGIDTAAEIFIDGVLFATTENMLIPHEFPLDELEYGKHELVVHIIPTVVYVRSLPSYSTHNALRCCMDSLLVRKAPYMFGWDIMPRIVSGGLWRPVSVVYKPKSRLEDVTYRVTKLDETQAEVLFDWHLQTDKNNIHGFVIRVQGNCGDSTFEKEFAHMFSFNERLRVKIDNPKPWWPKNHGDAALYDTTVTLLYNGEVCDTVHFNVGLRIVQLDRTSLAGPDGKFRFIVNGKPIFILGTNWVPTDPFPSRHDEYTLRGLELTNDLQCNMIRCWGGNVYPSEMLYDYCDEHGILVWQDFGMACGVYPNDERMCALIREETEVVVKMLRNHPCVALWSGDNECDWMCHEEDIVLNGETIYRLNPNDNVLTRQVMPKAIYSLDVTRPYIPSSPYIDEEAFAKGGSPSEDHLWGPRDYFKGEFYYTNSVAHFASETGYHGCPSPATLREIIAEDRLNNHGDGKICTDGHWLVHATCMTPDNDDMFAYRIPLMSSQIERIFDKTEESIEGYATQSQISQGEAVKFFIEHFRIENHYRGGLIWWNVIDGWPQVSDAIVDWYGRKKLAYGYIKRSQQPFCMMCDEPDENGDLKLFAVNDTTKAVTVSYTVTEAVTGRPVASGNVTVDAGGKCVAATFPEIRGEYYYISWNGDVTGNNHFTACIGDKITLESYRKLMAAVGFDRELEGF